MDKSECRAYNNIWKSRVQYYEQETEKAKKDLEYWEQALKDTNYKDRAFIHRKWIGAKNYYRYTKDYYTLCKKKAAETEKRESPKKRVKRPHIPSTI